ncbi:unnamed protein product [Allacma fusca]|uniref:Uncharacterized protein n=1 Tax=Allacma fusca TaxID=39272 RepID=A0A8J2K1A2_9HEXA|nr:unnamed protein product [Allacma fusca]
MIQVGVEKVEQALQFVRLEVLRGIYAGKHCMFVEIRAFMKLKSLLFSRATEERCPVSLSDPSPSLNVSIQLNHRPTVASELSQIS